LIINNGKVVQIGTPKEIYQQPNTIFSAFFFGVSNLIPAQLTKQEPVRILFRVGNHTISCLSIQNGKSESHNPPKDEYVLTVKAENIKIETRHNKGENSSSGTNEFVGKIIETYFLGKWAHVEVEITDFPKLLTVAIPSIELNQFELNTDVSLTIDPKHFVFFNEPWARIKELEDS
jgi:ABC-type Fe3+/spermidine/putrescine transport system ATPase subunit